MTPLKKGDKVKCIAVHSIGGNNQDDFCKAAGLKMGEEYEVAATERDYRGLDENQNSTPVVIIKGLRHAHRASNFEKI